MRYMCAHCGTPLLDLDQGTIHMKNYHSNFFPATVNILIDGYGVVKLVLRTLPPG